MFAAGVPGQRRAGDGEADVELGIEVTARDRPRDNPLDEYPAALAVPSGAVGVGACSASGRASRRQLRCR
ncbi:hypothetical protein OG592_00980 [Streptomyces avidinii]|uniref:hypothetical protein n=1 Tax=Streptomyces avidinii TaxID=1895 RepID=UPI003868ED32|nr:hypothetical protein OG592_00980 [Streptomyces avidinii]